MMRQFAPLKELAAFHFRSVIRNKAALFFNLVMPLAFLVFFQTIFGQEEGVLHFMLPGILTQMILTGGLVTMAIGVAAHHQTGTLRHLFTTPMSIGQWLASFIGASLALTALQMIVLLLTARLLYQAAPPANLVGMLVVWLISTLVSLGFGLVIGGLTKSPEAAMTLSLIAYFAMAFLGGAIMPLEAVSPLSTLTKLMPSHYMVEALNRTMIVGEGLGAVVGNVGLLTLLAIVLVGVAAWRTRRQYIAI